MTHRWSRPRKVAMGAALAVLGTAGSPLAGAGSPNPLEEARRAAEQASFYGVVELRWNDGLVTHRDRLTIQASGGAVEVRGGNSVMAAADRQRLVQHEGESWALLWPPQFGPQPRPDASSKYDTSSSPGPLVAGRPTTVVEVRQGGRLVERLFLDDATRLLLQREQYDGTGAATRSLAFETLTLAEATPPPRQPARADDHSPRRLSERQVASSSPAPSQLADGYHRLGGFRRSNVLHVLYSDGLYDLSVFEQRGRLDEADLPSRGVPVAVGDSSGWRYPWPGGHLVVWQAGDRVYTAVSDAPLDQLMRAVQSFPFGVPSSPSLIEKLRQACRVVVQPLAE